MFGQSMPSRDVVSKNEIQYNSWGKAVNATIARPALELGSAFHRSCLKTLQLQCAPLEHNKNVQTKNHHDGSDT